MTRGSCKVKKEDKVGSGAQKIAINYLVSVPLGMNQLRLFDSLVLVVSHRGVHHCIEDRDQGQVGTMVYLNKGQRLVVLS